MLDFLDRRPYEVGMMFRVTGSNTLYTFMDLCRHLAETLWRMGRVEVLHARMVKMIRAMIAKGDVRIFPLSADLV
jgi:hypothetical protein